MAHRHTIGVQFTGPDVEAREGHYHMLPEGGRTSTDPDNKRHTHTTVDGRRTSAPIPLDETDAKKGQKKKKKRGRPYN